MMGIIFMAFHGIAMLLLSFGFVMLAIYMAKYVSKEALLKYGIGLLIAGLLLSCVGLFSAGFLIPFDAVNMMGNQNNGQNMMNNYDDSKTEESESTTSPTNSNI